jgi:mitochondrial fission protein ELM1
VVCGVPVPQEIWVVLTHAVGDNDQCLALAESLGRPFRNISLDWPASSRSFDRTRLMELLREDTNGRTWRDSNGLHAPWPRMIICCGRRADGLAFWIKRQSGGRSKVVTIGRPHAAIADYDLVVAPPQYMLPERANVIRLPISMARARTEIFAEAPEPIMAPKPWFTLLLGGRVKQFVTSEAVLRRAALRAQLAAERCGGSIIVSTSRRTPPWLLAAVESQLTAPTIYRWSSRNADNPYATLLQRSAAVFVTGDSASMVLDACHSGAATYLIELPERMDVRRLWRRGLYGLIRKAALLLHNTRLQGMAETVDRAQEWLHAKRILRYPRDLRRFHSKVYEMGLARSAADFDPSAIPARRDVDDPLDAAGVQTVIDRCMAWLSPS